VQIRAIDTPAVLIDLDVVEANMERAQSCLGARGIALRPHIQTHRLPRLALAQLAQGAIGIACPKIGEAEAMADAGCGDILITFNIAGAAKLDRLAARPALGETARIVPNHACVVSSLFDHVHLIRGETVEQVAPAAARGRSD